MMAGTRINKTHKLKDTKMGIHLEKEMVFNVACYKCDKTCNNMLTYTLEDIKRYCVNENISNNEIIPNNNSNNFYFGYIVCPYTNEKIYVEVPVVEIQRRLKATPKTISNWCIYD